MTHIGDRGDHPEPSGAADAPGDPLADLVTSWGDAVASWEAFAALDLPPSAIRLRVLLVDLMERLTLVIGSVATVRRPATKVCGCTVGELHRHACGLVGHVDPPAAPDAGGREALTAAIRSVTDLWDEPLDDVHDIPPIVNAVLAAGFRLPEGD